MRAPKRNLNLPSSVLVVMPRNGDREALSQLFTKRGMEVLMVDSPASLEKLAKKKRNIEPRLAIIDLHLMADSWQEVYTRIRRLSPKTQVLFATDRSDPNLVLRAKTLGAKNFLRAPYNEEGLQHALSRMAYANGNASPKILRNLPAIRTPIRVKIILPYIIMAIIIGIGVAFVVNQSMRDSAEERFVNQLIESGRLSSDRMVREEERLLGTLRLVANTQGMAQAIANGDSEAVRELALPIAVNNAEEAVEVLDLNGVGLIGLRRNSSTGEIDSYRGEQRFRDLAFVQTTLAGLEDQSGDKYSGLSYGPNGVFFYVSGPVRDANGNLAGVILVGKSILTISREIREDTLSHIIFYDPNGNMIESTLLDLDNITANLNPQNAAEIMTNNGEASLMLPITAGGDGYRMIVSHWEARGGTSLGVMGSALPETILVLSSGNANVQVFMLLTLAFLVVIVFGLLVARRISMPLLQVVEASQEVARGNFEVKIPTKGDDEIAVLAHSFNHMTEGLREGLLYRNLLGRTVSPEVRDQLRENLATGDVQLQGQFAISTVLIADVHGFTTISETEDPSTVLKWLNELFSELVPIITSYDGVVNEISGDALFAFFGILPRPMDGAESAYLASRAAVEMLTAVDLINEKRKSRGDSPITMGIGINTGPVTAGGLGAEDRLHYTVIGDAVNTAHRIENLAHDLDESAALISRQTLIAMWERRQEFNLETYGNFNVKGKREELRVYRLWQDGLKVNAPLDIESLSTKT